MKQQTLIHHQLADQARRAVREASPWIERLGRFGYVAKGLVYALVGWLAALAATGGGGRITDQEGALRKIEQAPFGQVLLIAIAIGLVGYAVWRFTQALRDTEHKGTNPLGIVARANYAVIGSIYAALAYSALQMAIGAPSRGGSSGASGSWTAWLLIQPFGPWVVGLVGIVVIGVGCYQFYKAYTAEFRQRLKRNEMSRNEERWMVRIGRFGLAARGVVFWVIGSYPADSPALSTAGEAGGIDGPRSVRGRRERAAGALIFQSTACKLPTIS
jgi:hypothetical protein